MKLPLVSSSSPHCLRLATASLRRLVLPAIPFFFSVLGASAATVTFTWDNGGGDGQWTTAANWNPDTAPVAAQYQGVNDIIVTGLAGTTTTMNLTGPVRIRTLTFGAGTATLSGGDFTTVSGVNLLGALSGGTVTINNNISFGGGITSNNTGTVTMNGNLSGVGGGTTNQALTLALYGNNTTTGNYQFTAGGTLRLGSNTAAGTGFIRLSDNDLNASATLNLDGARSISNTIHVDTLATWVPANPGARAAQISGSDLVTSGGLELSRDTAAAGRDQYLRINNSVTEISGVVRDTNTITATGDQFFKYGTGTLKLSGSSSNTSTRQLVIATGTVEFAKTGTANSWAGNIQNNATLNWNKATSGDNEIYAGVISGTGTLIKQGLGTLNLTGANTYTGATTVSSGTLLINGDSSAATGSVNVASGATLGGAGTLGGVTTLDGILAPGNSIGTLTIASDVIWNGTLGNSWKFELGALNASDLLSLTGSTSDFLKGTGSVFNFDFMGSTDIGTFTLVDWSDLAMTNFLLSDFSGSNLGSGYSIQSFAFNGSSLQVTIVPEPSTCILFMTAGLVVFGVRRRSRV